MVDQRLARPQGAWLRHVTAAAGLMTLLVGAGCGPRPPALQAAGAAYENAHEGLTFRPPAAWRQRGLVADPGGPAPSERFLVKYKHDFRGGPAFLSVTMVDLPEGTTLDKLLARRSPGSGWGPPSRVETLQVRGRPAARVAYSGRQNDQPSVREVVAVRRDRRVYFFTGTFPRSDPQAREQIRQAVGSIVWEGGG
jgi:hypothetical protein